MVDEKRLKVVYKKGDEMLADGFSKPYDPVKHKPFAIALMGPQKSVNGWALEDMMKSDLKNTKKSDEGDQNKRKETGKGVRSCPILEKGLKEKKASKRRVEIRKSESGGRLQARKIQTAIYEDKTDETGINVEL